MKTSTTVITTYECSLERAFKTAILCDVSKIHTGKGIMPKVTHCTEDENWGQPGDIKKVHVAKSLTQKGGFGSTDAIIERRENQYWKIEVANFQSPMLGIQKMVGEWQTDELDDGKIQITYTYTIHSRWLLLYPFVWLFTKTFWRSYMKQVLRNIFGMIKNEEPYQFD